MPFINCRTGSLNVMTDILTTKRLVILAVAAKCWLIFSSLTEMLLEIGFIEEMRTTGGNEEVPKIFLPNLLICENTIYPFDYLATCDITTGCVCKNSSLTKERYAQ